MIRPSDAARLVLLGAIWGASFLFIKVALEDMTPIQIVAGRVMIGAALLLLLARARSLQLPRGKQVWWGLVFMAIVGNLVPFALITWGQERITSSLAAILNSTTPLFTALLATAVLAGERLTPVRAAGIALGFAGVVVIVGDPEGGGLAGQLAVVAASASYGVGFVFARSRLAGRAVSPLALSAGQLLLGSLFLTPLLVWDAAVHPPSFTLDATLSVIALGAAGTGLAYLIYYRLVTDVGATTASMVTYLIPLFGTALGWIVLDESLQWNALVGAVLVIAGIALAERGARRGVPHTLEPVEATEGT